MPRDRVNVRSVKNHLSFSSSSIEGANCDYLAGLPAPTDMTVTSLLSATDQLDSAAMASVETPSDAKAAAAPFVVSVDNSSFTVNPSPPVTVANGATVEIDGSSGQSVGFAGTTGTLKLDDALAFSGQVSGLTGSDALDLADVSYGPNTTATFSGNLRGGTLTVRNGTETARIDLVGDYLKSGWTLSNDGNGGTVVVDPPGFAFPNATNTGVSAGVTLKPSGSLTISAPGVYSGLDISGGVVIDASNVTLENCVINMGTSDNEAIAVAGGLKNVVIQNCEVAGSGPSGQSGDYGILIMDGTQVTINACNIHDVASGIVPEGGTVGSQVTIENSYIHNLNGGAGSHINGIGFFGQSGPNFSLLIQGNTVVNSNDQTDAIMLQNYFGSVKNVTVNNNLLIADNYTMYIAGNEGTAPVTNVTATNNAMSFGQYGYFYIVPGSASQFQYTVSGNYDDASLVSALPASPVVSMASAAAGNYSAGNTLTLTLYTSEAMKASGMPTLTLNDGGTATYTGGSGTDALTFSYTVANGQNTSALAVTAVNGTITDLDGNALSTSNLPATFAGVTVGPHGVPIITSFSPDTGTAGDDITNATVVTLNGTAVAGSTVNLYDGATLIGTTAANAGGAWGFTTSTLSNGTHSFTATDTASGVTSAASAPLAITVDTIAPAAPIISSDEVSNTNVVTLTGIAEADSAVNIYSGATRLGTASVNQNGAFSFTTASLSSGSYSFTATATDAAGNVSAASSTLDLIVLNPPIWSPMEASRPMTLPDGPWAGMTLEGRSTLIVKLRTA